MRSAAATACEYVAGWAFELGGGDARGSRLSWAAYEFAGWVDSWKRQ